MRLSTILLCIGLVFSHPIPAQDYEYFKKNYTKKEVYIPMRDGAKLYTAIYTPRDTTVTYPILLVKTPYGIKPYGPDTFPNRIGPSLYMEKEKYIFVHQDARGMFLSTGTMLMMTPHRTEKPDSTYTDNSTDTYDAVEWLLKHTPNNGNVGLWGISYRGFYASSGIIDAHPAIKCSSPQAPIADWYVGDDMHHHGAFALLPAFDFAEVVDRQRDTLFTDWLQPFNFPVKDAYNFFLELGKLSEVNENYFHNEVPNWDTIMAHPDYDAYWQKRNILPHLKDIKPAVMVVGGLFDQENLYGSLQTYRAIRDHSQTDTRLVLGPWIHGGWARTTGDHLGPVQFGADNSEFYQKDIEVPFFNYYLKGKEFPEEGGGTRVFTTGINTWSVMKSWPPPLTDYTLYLDDNFSLSAKPYQKSGFIADEYVADPSHPVPYTQVFHPARLFYNKEYMTEDQRFAAARPDVLSYQTSVLEDTLILQGPISAELFVSSNTTDYDLVVKIIDVYPAEDTPKPYSDPVTDMAGYMQLVRLEIFRAKYRNSYEHPTAILPGKIEKITIPLNDISHAFLPGHRVMVQIQSSLFPLYDRNPQQFMNIYRADKDDFRKATLQIYHSKEYPSAVHFNVRASLK